MPEPDYHFHLECTTSFGGVRYAVSSTNASEKYRK